MTTISKTIRFPKIILEQINPVMKKNKMNFTEFILNSITRYLNESNYVNKINKSFGSWNNDLHHELKNGTSKYIRKIREERHF